MDRHAARAAVRSRAEMQASGCTDRALAEAARCAELMHVALG
ncbi:hypothetical protein [Microbacterium pseudoresistens]|uniref:Uncharacterized protein n=1 Tax=Microbacterium pseudoresistens TaxID=640634 RepID=A0A7Y9JN30_9MICO|nr:hypothetical protein [Microbacterium pseudoresistens]NYD54666.1 hypothetical protein [Microbacterium pseudoresistens]